MRVEETFSLARPRVLGVHIVEGPYPIDGRWTLESEGDGTRAQFEAWGEVHGAAKLITPVMKLGVARQFAQYHRNLRRNVEAL